MIVNGKNNLPIVLPIVLIGFNIVATEGTAKELIKNVTNLLNAEVHYKTLLDSRGIMKKQIEITYEDEETKTSSKK